ncbi:MAG: hypothetical protein AB8G15_01690 [Saprospiraceae bacterium]
MSNLELIRLLLDAGLLVLIWMVQLVVYPSFRFYQKENLLRWHQLYTQRISYVVLPLMLGQIVVAGLQVWEQQTWMTSLSFGIVFSLWAMTFLVFVPLHNKIANDTYDSNSLAQLVAKNWWRTVLWTLVFLLSLKAQLF